MIHLTINGKAVEVEEGSTILEAARKVNIDIPTLCFLKDINEYKRMVKLTIMLKNDKMKVRI